MTFTNIVSAILVGAWIILAIVDTKRSILFALMALSNGFQLAKVFIPLPVYTIGMLIVGVLIIAEAQLCCRKDNRGAIDILYILIGATVILNGIVAF